jgi:hypothetical protein
MNIKIIALICLISGLFLSVTFSPFLSLLSSVDPSNKSNKNKILNYLKILMYGSIIPALSFLIVYYSGFMSTSLSFGGFDNDQTILVGNPGF